MSKLPNDKELDDAIDAAFKETWDDVNFWNSKVAGTPRTPRHPEDLEPEVKFSHKSWTIATVWTLIHRGFTIDGSVMLQVVERTGSRSINAD